MTYSREVALGTGRTDSGKNNVQDGTLHQNRENPNVLYDLATVVGGERALKKDVMIL